MSTVKELKATERKGAGKGAARATRREGRVPAVIYGDNKTPLNISLDQKELTLRIHAGRFLTTVHDIDVDGTKHRVIPRDFQLDAVKDFPIHVDFLRLGEGALVRVNIPIRVFNSELSPGVKRGGAVNIVRHTVEVRCRPDAIPQAIEVDVATLDINHSKHLDEITLPDGVAVIGRPNMTLVTIVPPSGMADEKADAASAAAAAATSAASAEAAAGDKKAAAGDAKKPAGDAKKPDAKK